MVKVILKFELTTYVNVKLEKAREIRYTKQQIFKFYNNNIFNKVPFL